MIKSAITKAYYNNQALLDGVAVITVVGLAVAVLFINVGGL